MSNRYRSENSDSVNLGSSPSPPAIENPSSATTFAHQDAGISFPRRSPNANETNPAPHINGHKQFAEGSPKSAGEEWRPVVGFEGRYEVSDAGRVRSLSTYRPRLFLSILRPWTMNRGYQYLSLRHGDGTRVAVAVHRAVLDAFVGPCPEGHQAAHWNGDPADNHLINLRWATSAQNHADRRRHGRIPSGERNAAAKLDRSAVKTIKKLRGLVSGYELAHLACVDPTTIERIWRGEAWKTI